MASTLPPLHPPTRTSPSPPSARVIPPSSPGRSKPPSTSPSGSNRRLIRQASGNSSPLSGSGSGSGSSSNRRLVLPGAPSPTSIELTAVQRQHQTAATSVAAALQRSTESKHVPQSWGEAPSSQASTPASSNSRSADRKHDNNKKTKKKKKPDNCCSPGRPCNTACHMCVTAVKSLWVLTIILIGSAAISATSYTTIVFSLDSSMEALLNSTTSMLGEESVRFTAEAASVALTSSRFLTHVNHSTAPASGAARASDPSFPAPYVPATLLSHMSEFRNSLLWLDAVDVASDVVTGAMTADADGGVVLPIARDASTGGCYTEGGPGFPLTRQLCGPLSPEPASRPYVVDVLASRQALWMTVPRATARGWGLGISTSGSDVMVFASPVWAPGDDDHTGAINTVVSVGVSSDALADRLARLVDKGQVRSVEGGSDMCLLLLPAQPVVGGGGGTGGFTLAESSASLSLCPNASRADSTAFVHSLDVTENLVLRMTPPDAWRLRTPWGSSGLAGAAAPLAVIRDSIIPATLLLPTAETGIDKALRNASTPPFIVASVLPRNSWVSFLFWSFVVYLSMAGLTAGTIAALLLASNAAARNRFTFSYLGGVKPAGRRPAANDSDCGAGAGAGADNDAAGTPCTLRLGETPASVAMAETPAPARRSPRPGGNASQRRSIVTYLYTNSARNVEASPSSRGGGGGGGGSKAAISAAVQRLQERGAVRHAALDASHDGLSSIALSVMAISFVFVVAVFVMWQTQGQAESDLLNRVVTIVSECRALATLDSWRSVRIAAGELYVAQATGAALYLAAGGHVPAPPAAMSLVVAGAPAVVACDVIDAFATTGLSLERVSGLIDGTWYAGARRRGSGAVVAELAGNRTLAVVGRLTQFQLGRACSSVPYGATCPWTPTHASAEAYVPVSRPWVVASLTSAASATATAGGIWVPVYEFATIVRTEASTSVTDVERGLSFGVSRNASALVTGFDALGVGRPAQLSVTVAASLSTLTQLSSALAAIWLPDSPTPVSQSSSGSRSTAGEGIVVGSRIVITDAASWPSDPLLLATSSGRATLFDPDTGEALRANATQSADPMLSSLPTEYGPLHALPVSASAVTREAGIGDERSLFLSSLPAVAGDATFTGVPSQLGYGLSVAVTVSVRSEPLEREFNEWTSLSVLVMVGLVVFTVLASASQVSGLVARQRKFLTTKAKVLGLTDEDEDDVIDGLPFTVTDDGPSHHHPTIRTQFECESDDDEDDDEDEDDSDDDGGDAFFAAAPAAVSVEEKLGSSSGRPLRFHSVVGAKAALRNRPQSVQMESDALNTTRSALMPYVRRATSQHLFSGAFTTADHQAALASNLRRFGLRNGTPMGATFSSSNPLHRMAASTGSGSGSGSATATATATATSTTPALARERSASSGMDEAQLQAVSMSGVRSRDEGTGITLTDEERMVFDSARRYAHLYKTDRSVLVALQYEAHHRWDLELIARAYASHMYRFVMYTSLVLLLALGFFEGGQQAQDSTLVDRSAFMATLLRVEGCCIVFQFIDVLVGYRMAGMWKQSITLEFDQSELDRWATRRGCCSRPSSRGSFRALMALRSLLAIAITADFVWRAVAPYDTGVSSTLLPLTSVLRPALLVLRVRDVRHSMLAFLRTIIRARQVLALFVSFLAVTAALSLSLLSSSAQDSADVTIQAGADGSCSQELVSTGLGRGFDTFQASYVTMLIFVMSSENYANVVYPSSCEDVHGRIAVLYKGYFIAVSFVGLFVMISLLIATFQSRFSATDRVRVAKQLASRRVALITAFAVLDTSSLGYLRPSIVRRFFSYVQVKPSHWRALSSRPQVAEFVGFCEYLILDKSFSFERRGYQSLSLVPIHMLSSGLRRLRLLDAFRSMRRWLRQFFNNELTVKFDSFIALIVLSNVWAVSLYGTRVSTRVDSALGGFLAFYAAEVLLRVVAVGPKTFWKGRSSVSRQHVMYQTAANRFDLIVIAFSVALYLGSQVADGVDTEKLSFSIQNGVARLAVTLPVIRLFTVIHSTRYLVFGLLAQFHVFFPLLMLMACCFYVFAVVGVWQFSGKLSRLPTYEIPGAHFDSLGTAMTTLFQLMTTEGFADIMYAAVDVSASLTPIIYFVVFEILVALLFTNLFIGIVCDTFSELQARLQSQTGRLSRKSIVDPA